MSDFNESNSEEQEQEQIKLKEQQHEFNKKFLLKLMVFMFFYRFFYRFYIMHVDPKGTLINAVDNFLTDINKEDSGTQKSEPELIMDELD